MKRVKSLLVAKEETALNVFKLKAMARGKQSLAILMFGSPDPDAVASAMALQEILKKTAGINKCTFIATEPVVRQQNREFIRAMKLDIQQLNKNHLSQYDLIALVDAQPTFFGQSLENIQIKPKIVLDHHPCATVWHAELADIRPSYGSLSTMMMEYLLAAKIRISKKLYTALFYGIKTDTNNFERDAILEDIGAYYLAYARANRQLIRRIELNQIPERFLKYYDYAFHFKQRYRERIVCFLGKVENTDICVQVADFFLRLSGINFVVIAGIVKDRFVIIFRGDGYRQDCGAAAIKGFGGLGSAGGHKSAARVEIPLDAVKEHVNDDFSQRSVDDFLVQRLRRKRKVLIRPNNGKS
jgi:nanoRNase/pAp phosphatase (c-di-AMP/oligoRNAs hydrolase)